MWDDFTVGDVGEAASAVTVTPNLAENASAYWWRDSELEIGGKLSKESPQGKKVADLVSACAPSDKIDDYIFKVAISRMSAARIVSIFTQVRENAYKLGAEHKARDIRRALGI